MNENLIPNLLLSAMAIYLVTALIVPLMAGNEVLSQLRCMDELQRTELLENQSFNTIRSPGPLPEDFLSFCDRKGIIVLQYSPLSRTANSSLSMHPCLILTEEQD